jgi:AraC-like DNA-binding protein
MNPKIRDSHLRVLWIARINYSKNSGVKPHIHDDFYQLLFVIEGVGMTTINSQSFPLLAGNCYLFQQGVEHSFRFTEETTTLDIKFALEKELAAAIFASGKTGPFFVTSKNQLIHLFQLSRNHLRDHPDTLLHYRIDSGFKYFFLSMILDQSTPGGSDDWVSPDFLEQPSNHPGIQFLIEYLNKNLQGKINLEEIANEMGFHPHYLIELFRKHLGTTPIKYLQMLRLERSKEYLEFTDYPISEIAEMVGLTPPYFSRLFCERIGISPSQYREKTRILTDKDFVLEQNFTIESQPKILTL